jgi:hypothetical protein
MVGLGASGAAHVVLEAQSSGTAATSNVPTRVAAIQRYCVGCHNQRLRTAGLTLDALDLEKLGAAAPVWEKVVKKLRSGAMPPVGAPQPDRVVRDDLASWIETELDHAAAVDPNPGRPAVHRLNRTEYGNAIRDLLVLEIDARSLLPADDAAFGFDNNADLLSVSPTLLDRYVSAAEKVSRLAIGNLTMSPRVESYGVSQFQLQTDRVGEELPFGSRGGIAVRHHFPLDGEYGLRIRLRRDIGQRIRGNLTREEQVEIRLDGKRVGQFTIGGAEESASKPSDPQSPPPRPEADAGWEVRLPIKAGMRLVTVAFLNRHLVPEGVHPGRFPSRNSDSSIGGAWAEVSLDTLLISGPYRAATSDDTPSRRKIFGCYPRTAGDEQPCATKILSRLARQAYRRPVTTQDLRTVMNSYHSGRKSGGFDTGIEIALRTLLVSPDFLFRIERDPVPTSGRAAHRLSDVELASRLSFFLWSSIPDEELLDVAERGRLKDPSVLEQQVRRMWNDQRAGAVVSNFGAQWLYLRNVKTQVPDIAAFPEFDDSLREAFQRETELFFESQVREDRPVAELLTANYTFLNERLARHYGILNVYGSHFRRVPLLDDSRRGLLGQGSILMVTSFANRTSPVVRGKWLLENILGAPPPPPPANVPVLPTRGEGGKPASIRERMEQHRKNPVCASCHARMDPLGFALENYDAIGSWRTRDEYNVPVESASALPDGTKLNGAEGLRTYLVGRQEEFVRTVIEKLLAYAVGRGVDYYDMPAIRKVKRDAAAKNYTWAAIILELVRSTPFQMRKGA